MLYKGEHTLLKIYCDIHSNCIVSGRKCVLVSAGKIEVIVQNEVDEKWERSHLDPSHMRRVGCCAVCCPVAPLCRDACMGKSSCSIQLTGNASGWLLERYYATYIWWQRECKFFIMYTCAHWSFITRSALCPPLAIQEALCWPTFPGWIMPLTLLHTCGFWGVN